MKKLKPNWITDGLIDFEYKKYILLDYFQGVDDYFRETKLYPVLSDVIFHYQNLVDLKEKQASLEENLPKEIKRLDLKNLTIHHEKKVEDDKYLRQIQDIIDYAIPAFKKWAQEGKGIYDFVEEKLEVYPVGVVSLYKDEGFLLLGDTGKKNTLVYEYKVSIYEDAKETLRSLRTKFVRAYEMNIMNTYEKIRKDIIQAYSDHLSNPATYAIESSLHFPLRETLLPIAKRTFMRYLASAA